MTGADASSVAEKSGRLVFHYLVEAHARATPDKPCMVMDDRVLTYAQVEAEANRWARGLAQHGVRKGDRVLLMIPSGIEHVLIWLGLCKLGALMVPVNEAYKGNMLRHQASDSAAAIAIVDQVHVPRWIEVAQGLPDLKVVALYPDLAGTIDAPWQCISVAALRDTDGSPMPRAVEYFDPMAIFYTSGTTGPSKGVLYSYAQAHATAAPMARLCSPDDVFYMFLPMFHVGLSNMFGIVVIAGATMAIRERFSASRFWPDVRRYRAGMSILLSTMPNFLLAQPATPRDRDHSLKKVIIIPLFGELAAFRRRFGCEVTTFYNMTEVSIPLAADGFNLVDGTSCGRPRPGVTARVVDEHDEPVAPGTVGELVLRADEPWEFNLGYWRNPEKTAEAWRNQWLHTGDAFRADADGNFYFVDRLKDAIRRRGENISSFEVEAEVEAHPAILESAAVAVPASAGEDEVKVVVALKSGERLDPAELHGFLQGRLPAYMVPRYIEVRSEELPKTPTGKIRKAALREDGVGSAWDRGETRKPAPQPTACEATNSLRRKP
jgi:crotonobetaine/carnitine-CoA ligase